MDLQGYVLAAAVVMLLVYALPAVADRRRLMAATRLEDRHSDRLRVLATVGDGGRRGRASPGHPGRVMHDTAHRPTAPQLLPIGPESRAMSTIKPRLSEPARRARDLAHARSQRAARMSRRDAARNRRVMYQVVLGLLTVAAWALVSYAGWHLTAVIVPAVLLVAVVALSVRAAGERRTLNSVDRAEIRRIDGELRALSRRPRERELEAGIEAAAEPGAADATAQIAAGETGGQTSTRSDDVAARTWATVSSDRLTSGVSDAAGTVADRQERLVPAHDGAEGTGRGDAPAQTAQDESGWTPVPVPASRWAGDGSDAPRRTAPAFEAPAAPSARVPLRPTRPSSMGSSVVAGSGADAPEPGAPRASVLDLDAALARRRAKGA